MKNANERHKEKSKLSVLKKKLSMAEKPDDIEQKLKKGKKSKKSSEDDQNVKSCKTSSFIRKFNFGKYMTTPSNIRRASSSKSVTASETSDRLSSGYSTLTPTSLKRQFAEEVEDTVSEEVYVSETPVDTCIEVGELTPSNDKQESGITSRQPVSVTPYAISAWRSTNATGVTDNETEQNQSHLHHDQQHNARVSSSHTNTEPEQQFMDDKLTAENNESEHREEDEQNSEVHVITEESSETHINKSDKIQKVDGNESVIETMPAFGNVVMDVLRSRPETVILIQPCLI